LFVSSSAVEIQQFSKCPEESGPTTKEGVAGSLTRTNWKNKGNAKNRKGGGRRTTGATTKNRPAKKRNLRRKGIRVIARTSRRAIANRTKTPTTKKKGVAGLIQIENPNRRQLKAKKLATLNESLDTAEPAQLSRREREELERQRKKLHYQKLQAEGKTEEARADLARLAIIKQQRAEAAKKREDEKKEKEMAKIQKSAETQRALGK